MTLTLHLSPELEKRLAAAAQSQGVAPADFALRMLDEGLGDADRRRQTVAMLDSWLQEEAEDDDRAAYEDFTRAIDEDRPSSRKLFPPELKGITW